MLYKAHHTVYKGTDSLRPLLVFHNGPPVELNSFGREMDKGSLISPLLQKRIRGEGKSVPAVPSRVLHIFSLISVSLYE